MVSAARHRPRTPRRAMWKVTLPEWKYAGRANGRQKPRVSARLEGTEGFSDYYPHMRARAGAGAQVPFYTINPSVPSIILCKCIQLSNNTIFFSGRIERSTLTPPSSSGRVSVMRWDRARSGPRAFTILASIRSRTHVIRTIDGKLKGLPECQPQFEPTLFPVQAPQRHLPFARHL